MKGRNQRNDDTCLTGAILPTPKAGDGDKGVRTVAGARTEYARKGNGSDLPTIAALLPTPVVNDMGEGKTPEQWDGWRQETATRRGNSTLKGAHGDSLAIEATRLLPTPRAGAFDDGTSVEDWDAKTEVLAAEYDNGNGRGTSLPIEAQRMEGQWGPYAAAVARWEGVTRSAPPPTETGTKGQPRLSPAFPEWMMGLPAGHVTDVPGVTRAEALKLLGNGVVIQQAEYALRELLAWE